MSDRRTIELTIDETTDNFGVEAVSLVRYPAIESNFIFFNRQGKGPDRAVSLAQIDEEQQTLIGPALIPDKMIPRLDEPDGEEYDVFFTKDTVKRASELFLQQNRTNQHTFEHQTDIDGVSVVESWLVQDPNMDKSKAYGLSVPEGTWMVRVKVGNEDVWNSVKSGEVRGFSIEGYFVDQIVEMAEKKPKGWLSMLRSLYDDMVRRRTFFAEVKLEDGTPVQTEADAFGPGVKVNTTNDEGQPVDLASGTYKTEAGVEFQIMDNLVTVWDGESLATEEPAEAAPAESEPQDLAAEMYSLYQKHYMKTLYNKHYGNQ